MDDATDAAGAMMQGLAYYTGTNTGSMWEAEVAKRWRDRYIYEQPIQFKNPYAHQLSLYAHSVAPWENQMEPWGVQAPTQNEKFNRKLLLLL